jgi:DNA-binding NarL/FixJ family response regulator
VIADDHAVLRESLTALLSTQADFEVAGTASNGQEALEVIEQQSPDVLVLDLFMPVMDGFEVLRRLDRINSKVASVVLTASESQHDFVQVVRLGARGLVLKADTPERLFTAIRTVATGELAFTDDVAQGVLQAMSAEAQPERAPDLHRLSERERQIAALVARGMKNKDIASQLSISENTVKRHLQSIFSKTGARDRLELAVIALTEKSSAA